MQGFVGFVDGSQSSNFGHKFIYWTQGGKFNPYAKYVHCFIVYEIQEPLGNPQLAVTKRVVHETTSTVYHERSLSERMRGSKCTFFELPGDATPAYEYTKKLIGEPYGYFDIAWFGFDCALEWAANSWRILFKKDWVMQAPRRNPWDTANRFCAEATAEACLLIPEINTQLALTFPPRVISGLRCPQFYKWAEENLKQVTL